MASWRQADVPPRRIRQLRDALVAFRAAYDAYLDATVRSGSSGGRGAEAGTLRQEVSATIPAATEAMRVARYEFAIYPPPAAGPRAPVIHGLRNTAFAHETPIGYVGMMGGPPVWQRVLDSVEASIAELEKQEAEALRVRRNPLYWGDRLLRMLLGIPAYLLSLIFQVPLDRIEDSPWGKLLRALTFLIELGLLLVGLRQVGAF